VSYTPADRVTLEKVWNWCEKNESDALAEAYFEVCTTVGALDPQVLCHRAAKPYWAKAYAIKRAAIKTRDLIGELILREIKIESKQGA